MCSFSADAQAESRATAPSAAAILEGVHLVDRAPLDPLTFGRPDERPAKARALVQQITDKGAEVPNEVARRFVIAPHRDGGQAQFIPRPVPTEGDPLTHVLEWARRHLTDDLSID